MWDLVRKLRDSGVTIFLTTHYIEEAEEMADRIGVINKGKLILVEDKATLMNKLGKAELRVTLRERVTDIPEALAAWKLGLSADGHDLTYTYDAQADDNGLGSLMRQLDTMGLAVKNLQTHKSSLEDIFVSLVHAP
jgi:ABC-2 type transport system ATP-binding protein